jgi:hypothetical protein
MGLATLIILPGGFALIDKLIASPSPQGAALLFQVQQVFSECNRSLGEGALRSLSLPIVYL